MLANRLRWKGKLVSEKQYNHRMRLLESNKKRKRSVTTENKDENPCIISGRRVVNLKVMAQHMDCTSCKAVLSLRNIEKETRRGLASIFLVRCRDCLILNIVPTDNVHPGPGNRSLFAVNSDAVAGKAFKFPTAYQYTHL